MIAIGDVESFIDKLFDDYFAVQGLRVDPTQFGLQQNHGGPPHPPPHIMAKLKRLASTDLNGVRKQLRKMINRKAVPTYATVKEIWMLAVCAPYHLRDLCKSLHKKTI